MTTIAYKDDIIAFDSRLTNGSTIIDDNFLKIIQDDSTIATGCGEWSEVNDLVYAFKNKTDIHLKNDAIVLIHMLNLGTLFECYAWEGKIYCNEIDRLLPVYYTYGTGKKHALTAMDMGFTAKQAVDMAAKRDIYTGGVIRGYDLKQRKCSIYKKEIINDK
jgi:20S proteasome alpha/beta subunit